MSRHDSREAILARRALFLTTALAAIGCPSQPTDHGGTGPVGIASSSPSEEPVDAPPLETSWEKVIANAPPRAVPALVSAHERTWLDSFAADLESQYATVREVWEAAPGCDPGAADCKEWSALADKAQAMYRANAGPMVGPCPGAKGITATVRARRDAHRRYIESLMARIETRLGGLAKRYGSGGEKEWGRLLAQAKEPPPRPCLKPCMRPDVDDIVASVPFAKDDSTLRLGDAAVKASLDEVLAQQRVHGARAQLVVRGHADPLEGNAQKLAEARAKAVADWLVGAGIPKPEVVTASAGSELAVERNGSDANRRVDFEVVVR
jgi:outer membrane protein OmpA-like peptidoglycan-associated protein